MPTDRLLTTFFLIIQLVLLEADHVCLNCQQVSDPVHCDSIRKCGPHSACYSEAFVLSSGSVRYNLGCKDNNFCYSFAHPRDTTSVCDECCHGDLCNAAACGSRGYPAQRGPLCYSCPQHSTADTCNKVTVCGRDELCYTAEKHQATGAFFSTSCRSKLKCADERLLPVVGRSAADLQRLVRSSSGHRSCCHGDLCNNGNNGVAAPTTSAAWTAWSAWSACTATCGGNGTRTRTRSCLNGGTPNQCIGNSTEVDHACADHLCLGPICLSCQAGASPRDCTTVEQCGPNSVCYLDVLVAKDGAVHYNSGCRDTLMCTSTTAIKRQADLACSQCCDTNLCSASSCYQQGFPTGRGPICFSCSTDHNLHCSRITMCNKDETCSITTRPNGGPGYILGCSSSLSCQSGRPHCCTGDICNNATTSSSVLPTASIVSSTATTQPSVLPTASIATPFATKPPPVLPTASIVTPTATIPPTASIATPTRPTATHTTSTTITSGWGTWEPWGPCSVTVLSIGGHRERIRHCQDSSCGDEFDLERRNCVNVTFCQEPVIDNVVVEGRWTVGSSVKLTCVARGNPPPDVHWTTGEDYNNVVEMPGNKSTILIVGVNLANTGLYLCRAANECGHAVEWPYYAHVSPA